MTPVRRIAGFGLTTPHADRLADFYVQAFGCIVSSSTRVDDAKFRQLMAVDGGAQRIRVQVGSEHLEMLQFDQPSDPYPPQLAPYDRAFQHFAIVVNDMRRAVARLERTTGWAPISSAGPELLPQRSGGVTAFKFRDPDGHPLEFLQFPTGGLPDYWKAKPVSEAVCGIDHSAISVSDTGRSISFYASLGFGVASRSFNHGAAQQGLDGIPDARVDVVALTPQVATPHLELLGYETRSRVADRVVRNTDVAATRLILEWDCDLPPHADATTRLVTDPDGHRLQLQR